MNSRSERIHRYQEVDLYIKNLHNPTDDKLREAFSPFRLLTCAKVMLEDGKSREFGFLCFSSPKEAIKVIPEMNAGMVTLSHCMLPRPTGRKTERLT